MPGTVNAEGILYTLSKMDYIFCPISADRVVLESSLRFASRINEKLIVSGKSNIKGLHLVWNLVDGREKTEQYHANRYICPYTLFQRLNSWVFLIFGKLKFEDYGNDND